MDLLILFVIFYCLAVGVVFLYRQVVLGHIERAFSDRRDRLAVSLSWAWANRRDLHALSSRFGEHRLGPIFLERSLNVWRVFNPLVLVLLGGILLYQWVFRGARGFQVGDCPATPNCSNYAIGAVLRYGLIHGIAKSIVRMQSCDGDSTTISFHERIH